MSTNLNTELRKVTAVTTLYHLCPLSSLEKWAAEARVFSKKSNKKEQDYNNFQNHTPIKSAKKRTKKLTTI